MTVSRLDTYPRCAYVGAMSIAVEHKKKVWTEAELGALPEDGYFHESPAQRRLLGTGGSLNGEDLLPGFQYAVADLFKEWEW